MRKRPSSSNSNSLVVFDEPTGSQFNSSSSENSNANINVVKSQMENSTTIRKRTRPGLPNRNDSPHVLNRGGGSSISDRRSEQSVSTYCCGGMFCNLRCNARSQSWMYTVLIILLGGAACTSVLVLGVQSAHRSSQKLFQRQAAEVVSSLKSSWREYETVLLWIHESCDKMPIANATADNDDGTSIYDQIGFCTRQEFSHLARHLDSLKLQLRSFQIAPNISHAHRPALEGKSSRFYESLSPLNNQYNKIIFPYIGITNVTFDKKTGDILERIPATEQPFYYPVHYVHPLTDERNQAVIEMDLFGDPEIRGDIAKAFQKFQPIMSHRFRMNTKYDADEEKNSLWEVAVVHPGIDTQIPRGAALVGKENSDHKHNHHHIARIVFRPANIMQRSITSVEFPERGGMLLYVFDATKKSGEASAQSTFLAGLSRFDNGTLRYLQEIDYSALENKEVPHISRSHRENLDIADHEWTIIAVPTGYAYAPSFEFVVIGSVLLFLGTIVVACLHYRSVVRAGELRSLKSEQTREKATYSLLQAQRERHLNDFIAHEVRNPLSSALAALSFIRDGVTHIPNNDVRMSLTNDVSTVQNSLDYINDLLRNMLDVHRTSEEDFALRYSVTNLKNALLIPVKDIASSRNRGRDVKFLVESSTRLWVEVDPLRLEQVLLNLAMDAAKYVDDGGFVRLRADVVKERVHLYVEDSGSGIPVENRDRLFQRYPQSLGLISQGTGVGLHICKTLVGLMGAKIWLDDSYDSGVIGRPGARFVIDLQRPPMTRCHQSPTGFCDGSCSCWQNGGDAFHARRESSSGYFSSPSRDDDDVVGACPNVENSASSTMDITLDVNEHSASVDEELLNLEEGCCSLLARNQRDEAPPTESTSPPAPKNERSVAVSAVDTAPSQVHKDTEDGTDSLPESLSLLFVDDDKTLRKLFCRSARRLHHAWQVSEAPNGETALEMVKENHYDLIFMDQYMESTSQQLLGTEVVRTMRDSQLVDETTTICGLSANEEKERFLSAGADYFLLKPIQCSKDALRDQILRVLREASNCLEKERKDPIQQVVGQATTSHGRQQRRSSC
ncbi:two-component sensor histidine kinase [Nitzschia inconspicua]|uniref:histidine kinase n=1 Tax=Nitzschia inconspicua TaxID=303405 RepID=A0A9K3LRE6_9STRA|nr:two-component sensor histidine kinase [Nitzschia inconspicua]